MATPHAATRPHPCATAAVHLTSASSHLTPGRAVYCTQSNKQPEMLKHAPLRQPWRTAPYALHSGRSAQAEAVPNLRQHAPTEPAVRGRPGGQGQVHCAQLPLVACRLRSRRQALQRAPVRGRARRLRQTKLACIWPCCKTQNQLNDVCRFRPMLCGSSQCLCFEHMARCIYSSQQEMHFVLHELPLPAQHAFQTEAAPLAYCTVKEVLEQGGRAGR